MNKIVALLFYILLLPYMVVAEGAGATPALTDIKQEITKSVNSYIADHKLYATYAVADSGEIFLKGAVGFFDVVKKRKLAVDDIMPLASMTKTFTAAAILLLQDRKLLDVHDPISKHLTVATGIWPKGKMPSWANKVTIHHLLTHSSGIVEHVRRFEPDRTRSDMQLIKDVIAYAVAKPLEYEPGTASTYSDTGFILLGLIVEAKTGKPLAAFLKKEFFTPLGMDHTYLASVTESLKVLDGKMTDKYPVGYASVKDDTGAVDARLVLASSSVNVSVVAYAGSAGASNVTDLIKWNIALHNGKILSKKSYSQMITPYFKASLDTGGGLNSDLGYGLYISKMPSGHIYYHHEGSSFGLRSDSGYLPSEDISIAILSNIVHLSDRNSEGQNNEKEQHDNRYMDIVDFRDSIFAPITGRSLLMDALAAKEAAAKAEKDHLNWHDSVKSAVPSLDVVQGGKDK